MYSSTGKKITSEQFDLRIKDSNFTRIDDYINTNTSIRFRCNSCNKVFRKKPKEFYRLKCNCLDRVNIYNKTLTEKNIILLEPFSNVRDKLKHKCLKCENIFESSPKVVKSSIYGCPYCSGTKISNKDYINKLPDDIESLEIYVNSYLKIKHKCKTCNNTWSTKPNYILHTGCGCPFCKSSKGEKIISNILLSLSINFERQYPVKINNKTYYFDFYINDLKLCIEYDGVQHFESIDYFGGEQAFINCKNNDQIKDKWCNDHNIRIIRIPYYINDVDIEKILLSKIHSLI